ncbi:MAG: hypothetical protein ACPGJE_01195 [Wenzhouxiangellaceae bacterium]
MKSIRCAVVALLTLFLLVACQAHGDRLLGFPPRLELESLRLIEDANAAQIELVILLFNPNDVAVEVEDLQLEFSLNEQRALEFRRTLMLDIGARNRERIRLNAAPPAELVGQLEMLRDSGRGPMPYVLRGELKIAGARPAPVGLSDFLHRMPGQPNRFR